MQPPDVLRSVLQDLRNVAEWKQIPVMGIAVDELASRATTTRPEILRFLTSPRLREDTGGLRLWYFAFRLSGNRQSFQTSYSSTPELLPGQHLARKEYSPLIYRYLRDVARDTPHRDHWVFLRLEDIKAGLDDILVQHRNEAYADPVDPYSLIADVLASDELADKTFLTLRHVLLEVG